MRFYKTKETLIKSFAQIVLSDFLGILAENMRTRCVK